MEKDNLVKTTWRIPRDLYAELEKVAERDKTSINAVGIERLRTASISGRFDKIDREVAALKKMVAELLDKS